MEKAQSIRTLKRTPEVSQNEDWAQGRYLESYSEKEPAALGISAVEVKEVADSIQQVTQNNYTVSPTNSQNNSRGRQNSSNYGRYQQNRYTQNPNCYVTNEPACDYHCFLPYPQGVNPAYQYRPMRPFTGPRGRTVTRGNFSNNRGNYNRNNFGHQGQTQQQPPRKQPPRKQPPRKQPPRQQPPRQQPSRQQPSRQQPSRQQPQSTSHHEASSPAADQRATNPATVSVVEWENNDGIHYTNFW